MEEIQIWTDGSTTPSNPGPGGFSAVVVGDNNSVLVYSRFLKWATNNVAEAMAILLGIRIVKRKEPFDITFHTDSNYVISGINKVLNGTIPSSNSDVWRKISQEKWKHVININKVTAHADDTFNNLADKWAYRAAKNQENYSQSFDLSDLYDIPKAI